jgi:hypothetical protein
MSIKEGVRTIDCFPLVVWRNASAWAMIEADLFCVWRVLLLSGDPGLSPLLPSSSPFV